MTSSGRVVVSNAAADFGYPPLRVEPERETLGAARRCVCQSVPTLLAEFTPPPVMRTGEKTCVNRASHIAETEPGADSALGRGILCFKPGWAGRYNHEM